MNSLKNAVIILPSIICEITIISNCKKQYQLLRKTFNAICLSSDCGIPESMVINFSMVSSEMLIIIYSV